VDLARTGFDVGVLALFGGIALACGIALLLVQRRRIS
jgi:LPXTG-motif cell wall-anchored protein